MSVDVKITGLKELNIALAKLGDDIAVKHLRSAAAAAARVISQQAKQNAKANRRTGTLERAIYHKWIPAESNRFRQTFFISVKRGKRYRGREKVSKKGRKVVTKNMDAYYWWWVEAGHFARGPGQRIGSQKKRSQLIAAGSAKWIAPRPFLRPAFESKKMQAIEVFKQKLKEKIGAT